ncbi:hypothetical protein C8R43DRAFT_919701 [Mycena crocata]|nr:hypothetical protein C8R43DRAFT_919701 [Mycena crocata]
MNHEEDLARLPVGMKRIGYDADTARYTFCDEEGNTYIGPPNQEYGSLTLVDPSSAMRDRPNAFSTGSHSEYETLHQPLSMFHEMLPAHAMTSASSSESPATTPGPSNGGSASKFRTAVQRTALPSMQNVVNNVRRSVTGKRRDKEKTSLLRSGSDATSKPTRAGTMPAVGSDFEMIDEEDAKDRK